MSSAAPPLPLPLPPPLSRPSRSRIRFAPLPDPRRSLLLTDNGEELHLDLHSPSLRPPTYPPDDESSSSSAPSDLDQPTPPPTPKSKSKSKSRSLLRPFPFKKSSSPSSSSSSDSSNSLTPTPSNESSTAPSNPKSTNYSGAFSRINFSTEEILTLGTINLFRPSSRNNDSSNTLTPPKPVDSNSTSSSGWGLTRWTSVTSYTKGSPLARSQSTQSCGSTCTSSKSTLPIPNKKRSKPRANSTSAAAFTMKSPGACSAAASAPLAKTTSLPPSARKGTRMLNGRVYGGPKPRPGSVPGANPFANARDEDPEFVEWGYGGMGSVRGGRSAGVTGAAAAGAEKERTKWERLQSDGRGVVVGSFAGGVKAGVGGVGSVSGVVTGVDEDDDGSGMGWVKKRREARERERKEREAAAAASAGSTNGVISPEPLSAPPHLAPPLTKPALSSPPATAGSPGTPAATTTPTATPASASAVGTPTEELSAANGHAHGHEPEHILTAVTLPAHLPRHHSHHHRRVQSRSTSAEEVVLSGGAKSPGDGSITSPGAGSIKSGSVKSPGAAKRREEEGTSESESESESGSEDAVKSDYDEDDDDEDDDDEDDVELGARSSKGERPGETKIRRKTALGAGVEKISRHN